MRVQADPRTTQLRIPVAAKSASFRRDWPGANIPLCRCRLQGERPGRSCWGRRGQRSRAEASLQVGVPNRTVEEAEGSGVEQLPAGAFQHAERGSGQAAAQANPLDAE